VFVVEAEGKAPALAEQIYRGCHRLIGRATAVLAEVESKPQSIKDAAVKIGADEIGPDESFCFRLTKRGVHSLQDDTPSSNMKSEAQSTPRLNQSQAKSRM
jgi:tRNA(Ser,Leu) C12 N-acetylase TAN1